MEWISVKDKLPEDDRFILLWSESKVKIPDFSQHKIGAYIDGKFYAKEGINYEEEEITMWFEIPQRPKK